jgi:hypothetical protein
VRFRLIDLETWPIEHWRQNALSARVLGGIDGPLPAQAAKRIAEAGGKGLCVLEDEQGNRTAWQLHSTELHYAYPVLGAV